MIEEGAVLSGDVQAAEDSGHSPFEDGSFVKSVLIMLRRLIAWPVTEALLAVLHKEYEACARGRSVQSRSSFVICLFLILGPFVQ